jgi:hypothetical protein
MTEALFLPNGDRWLPTELARGPWSADSLHGGPVAALVTRAAELCEPDPSKQVVRLTLELLKPVPVAPLTVSARVVRPGRKVEVVDVTLADGDRELAWGRVVRLRLQGAGNASGLEPTVGPVPGRDPDAPAGPEGQTSTPVFDGGWSGFHNGGAELRFVDGHFSRPGPCRVWVRLAVPVVPGEVPSPTVRAAAAADFGNGVSSILDFTRFVFINPDLTVSLDRPPEGEWVCLDAATTLGPPGVGLAQSRLWDLRGPVGRSLQSLLVEPR